MPPFNLKSCSDLLGFIVMRLSWKALYKHVNEAQQQLRSQEEREYITNEVGSREPQEESVHATAPFASRKETAHGNNGT